MVGYQKDDRMTPNQKLFAGCISGAATRFITQPLDVVKLRAQLQKKDATKPKGRFFKYTRRIFTEEGFTAFWLGHNLGQIYSITAVTCQFYIYEQTTRFVAKHNLESLYYKPVLTYMCGFTAGCCSATLVVPLDVIRVRQMIVKDQYKGLLRGAREVYSHGGIFAFYDGLSATLLQMGPAVGLSFSVFSLVQPWILTWFHECGKECRRAPGNSHDPMHLVIATTCAGWCSALVSKTVTYPFDLAKRRMQIKGFPCSEKQTFMRAKPRAEASIHISFAWKVLYRYQATTELFLAVTEYGSIEAAFFADFNESHKTNEKYEVPSMSRNLASCEGVTSCILETYKREGFRGLFRGWKVTIFKAQITSVIAFTTYELICYMIRELETEI